jgi:hypothetical protein
MVIVVCMLGFYGIRSKNFPIFVLSGFFLGVFDGFADYLRFAAAEVMIAFFFLFSLCYRSRRLCRFVFLITAVSHFLRQCLNLFKARLSALLSQVGLCAPF